jgi:hypothetical protein
MADKCRELPRRPRGASFPIQLIPPCLPSHLERREGKEKKTSGVPDTSPTGSTGDNEETRKSEIFY